MAIKPEELTAANVHLEKTGMPRYGWLTGELRVAFHKAGIPPAQLRELGGHFVKIGDAKALADVMKAAAAKLTSSPQAAFQHLMVEAGKKAGVSSGTSQPTRPLISLAKSTASTTPTTTRAAAAPTTSRAPPAASGITTAKSISPGLGKPKTSATLEIERSKHFLDQYLPAALVEEIDAIHDPKYQHPFISLAELLPKSPLPPRIKAAWETALKAIVKRATSLRTPSEKFDYLCNMLKHLIKATRDPATAGERELQNLEKVRRSQEVKLGKTHITPAGISALIYLHAGRYFRPVEFEGENKKPAVNVEIKHEKFDEGNDIELALREHLDPEHFRIVSNQGYPNGTFYGRSVYAELLDFTPRTLIAPRTPQAEEFVRQIKLPSLTERTKLRWKKFRGK